MFIKICLFLALHVASVESSIAWMTSFFTVHDYADILRQICWRESRCTYQGLHAIDQKYSLTVWKKMVQRGLLRPHTCPFHRNPYEWSTSGPYGLMRAYHWGFLQGLCVPPWIIDIPPIATWVAFQKLKKHCQNHCTYQLSRKYWKGKK